MAVPIGARFRGSARPPLLSGGRMLFRMYEYGSQQSSFDLEAPGGSSELLALEMSDARCALAKSWLPGADADRLFEALKRSLAWKQEPVVVFGREVMTPRLTAFYGDADCAYTYSGLRMQPKEWTTELHAMRRALQEACDVRFNCVLANFYRDGNDSMGWHSDDEPELGPEPVIASVSLGAARTFRMRRKDRKGPGLDLVLPHGSLLVMRGATQSYWQHAVPRRTGCNDPGARINLTFRSIESAR